MPKPVIVTFSDRNKMLLCRAVFEIEPEAADSYATVSAVAEVSDGRDATGQPRWLPASDADRVIAIAAVLLARGTP